MPISAHKNFALSTLASPPSGTGGTSLTVATGQGALFPTAPFNVTVWPAGVQPTAANAEIMRVTVKASDTFTVTRAQEGSSARTFSANDQIAATITARTLTDVEYGAHGIVNVMDPAYGATGDGTTDDTAAIQAAVTAAGANGTVLFPKPASYYKCTGAITVASNAQTWEGASDSLVRWTALGAATIGPYGSGTAGIIVQANDFTLSRMALRGPTSGSYVANEVIVLMVGTSTSNRRSGLTIVQSEIYNSGSYGVFAQFVDNIRVERSYIHDCGSEGLGFFSCNRGRVYANRISTVTPGTGGFSEGLTLSHYSVGYDVDVNAGTKAATNPFCWDWDVAFNVVESCIVGLDAHGGYEVTFRNNVIHGCKRSIQLASGSGDATNYAGSDNKILFNHCDASDADGTASGQENLGPGIECGGGSTIHHRRLLVQGNTVLNHGVVNSTTESAIRASTGCSDSQFVDNLIARWGGMGILLTASDNTVARNQFGRLANAADTAAQCIVTDSSSGNLVVTDNVLRAGGGTAARVGLRAVSLTDRMLVQGNDFRAATVQAMQSNADGVVRGTDLPNYITVTNDATTQSVSSLSPGVPGAIHFTYTTPVTVTNLTGGSPGQIVTLIVTNGNTVTFDRSNAVLAGGANWAGGQYDSLTLMLVGSLWHEISRAANS